MERIYIGGLRPPHLTVQDLLERLERSLGDTLEIVPDTTANNNNNIDSACFVHVNAKVLNHTGSDTSDEAKPSTSTALEHIAKLYHNVTWKGQKLRVEKARPHFLQRLQDEIQQRNTTRVKGEEQEDTPSLPQQPLKEPSKRRHLKIRQRFGEQVFSVDTKPYKVDSWRGMEGLLRKIERRRIHYQQERKQLLQSPHKKNHNNNHVIPPPADIRTQSKLNRAVHLRFVQADEGDNKVNGHKVKQRLANDKNNRNGKGGDPLDDDQSMASSASSDSKDTTSETNTSTSNSSRPDINDATEKAKSASNYVWSSSSDDSDSEDDTANDTVKQHDSKTREPTTNHQVDPASKAPQKHSLSSSSSSSSSSSAEEQKEDSDADESSDAYNIKATVTKKDKDSKQQESSSDEDDSNACSGFDKKNNIRTTVTTKLPSELDEFASAMVGVEPADSNDDDDDDDTNNNLLEEEENNTSLVQDVETNLNVLASLFPDMKKMQPRKVASDVQTDNNGEEKQGAAHKKTQTGWTPGGIMFRYDPRNDVPAQKETTKEALPAADETKKEDSSSEDDDDQPRKSEEKLEDSSEENDSSEDSGSGKSSNNDSDSDGIADAPARVSASTKDEAQPNNEAKGDIYKQDKLEDVFRLAREGTISAQAVGVASEEPSGAFSFGFDLGTKEPVDDPSATDVGFSFSFPPAAASKPRDVATLSKQPADTATEDTKATAATPIDSKPQAPTFRRRGMLFPKDVLDRYQEDFYTMNDGLKILQDLERYHRDPEVQAHWKNERISLTSDWKRKRKYAQQARTKHQKHFKQQRR